MAEDLTEYYRELGVRVRYLHSDIDTLERIEILRDLRLGEFDVLVGINLLREGLDLPEVSLVAILDADKEGFLRSPRSLIQTIGRAARNVNGRVIMYADTITAAMKQAIDETDRRRDDPRGSTTTSTASSRTTIDARDHEHQPGGGHDRLLRRASHARRQRSRAGTKDDGRDGGRAHQRVARGDVRGGREPRVREGGAHARRAPRARGQAKTNGTNGESPASDVAGYNPYASKRKSTRKTKTGATGATSTDKNWKAKERRSSKWKP